LFGVYHSVPKVTLQEKRALWCQNDPNKELPYEPLRRSYNDFTV